MFTCKGVFIVCFGVYFVVWQGYNKRGQKKEAERIRAVRAKESAAAGTADEKTALRA
jgi:type II secretory pathway component PulM